MKNKLIITLLIIPVISFGNELHTQTWNFATPDESLVAAGKLHTFCSANPDKCPSGLKSGKFGGGSNGKSLFTPATSSSANQSTLTVVGNGNTVTLTTSQESENDQIDATSTNNADIEVSEVLNYTD